MGDQRLADLRSGPADQVEDAVWQTGLLSELGEDERAQWRDLAAFEDHGASGGKRRSGLHADHEQRHVPRRDRPDHARWQTPHERVSDPFLPPDLACALGDDPQVLRRRAGLQLSSEPLGLAEASLAAPDGTVRGVVFPAVAGGEQTLRELVHEFKTRGPLYRRTVQTTLKASYTNHYRRGLIRLLDVLRFRSNSAHQPVIEALELIRRFADSGNITYYPLGEVIPMHRGLRGDWEDVLYREDTRGRRRVVRMVYEVATLQALRDALRCKEIWVVGADRWRDPDEDLPADHAQRRVEHYRTLRKPLDPSQFVDELREEMSSELSALDDALPKLEWLSIAERRSGAIKLTALDAQPEPRNLRRVKNEVLERWGTVPLVDMLKETVLRTGCLDAVTSVTTGGGIRPDVLAERLLLAIYAYGTNTGIRAVASGTHGHTEDEIRYARRRCLTAEAARTIAIQIADATFAARRQSLWGAGSTAVASDSTHVRAFDQNILTEWHSDTTGEGS